MSEPANNPPAGATPAAGAAPAAATPAAPAAAAPAAAAPAAPPKPAMPAKPAAPAKAGETRRGFFGYLTDSVVIGWTAMVASLTAMTLGTTRFMFPNVLAEPPNRIKVGDPGAFEDGKVVDTYKDRGIWMVRNEGKIYALNTMCTHLGCTPNWLEADKKFKCPCHGSGFYITGINFEGPAPRPLERWAISVADDGQLLVDKSRKFQYELNQWDNKDSYYEA